MGMQYDHAAGRRITKRLRNLADRAEDVTPAWPKVGAYLSRQVRRQFATRGKHMGTPWKPLAASTRKQKRRLGYGRIPLVRSGDLRSSFIGRPMDVETYGKSSATFGSSLNKAVWQQLGTRMHGKQHIPPRPMLEVTPLIRKEATAILRKYIVGKGKGSAGIS
jgi:phage gpG-like protein